MATILEIHDLKKKYKDVEALKGLNVQVEEGMVFGILGPNGSGKTTTLGILLGVLKPTSGTYSWFNNGTKDENRVRIGALLETPNFYPYLSADQNLKIVAKIKNLDDVQNRIDKALKIVDLEERRKSKFKTYSLGMKQRLAIASALLNDPEVLVLDEPTNGLDPQGIAEIRNLIIDIGKQGKTILVASHQLDEIEKVCTDVVILKKGEVIKQGRIGQLIEGSKLILVKSSDLEQAKAALQGMENIKGISEEAGALMLEVEDHVTTEQVNKFCFENKVVLSELREHQKSLEDQFLEITKG